jgi:hypothetical protein
MPKHFLRQRPWECPSHHGQPKAFGLKALQTSGNGFMAVEMMDHPIGINEVTTPRPKGRSF